jgi:hypothetical protein
MPPGRALCAAHPARQADARGLMLTVAACHASGVFSVFLKNVLTQQCCSDLMRGSDDAKA